MAWQAPRQVAVSPGGALPGPAGWTRTPWTLQTHLSRFFSARSVATVLSFLLNCWWQFIFASTFFGIVFLPFYFLTSFPFLSHTPHNFIPLSVLICFSYQPPLFSNNFISFLFFFPSFIVIYSMLRHASAARSAASLSVLWYICSLPIFTSISKDHYLFLSLALIFFH